MTAQVTKEKGLLRMQRHIFVRYSYCIAQDQWYERSAGWLQWRPTRRSYCCCSLVVLCLKTLWAPRYSCLSQPAYRCYCNEPLKQLLPLYPTKIILDSLFIILRKREKQLSFLHVYHHATMWVKISICDDHSHHVYFAQVPPLVDWGQICGGRLQFLGETLNLTSLVWCHPDMFLFSGCLLQLLCPCDHVLLLRSLNSWGTCQVVPYRQLILPRTIFNPGTWKGKKINAKDWYRNA